VIVIVAIDLMAGNVVRLVKGKAEDKTIYSDDPVKTAARWASEGADMLHVVDLDATLGSAQAGDYNSSAIMSIISKAREAGNIPVQVAGGIRSIEAAEKWLEGGASKVVIGTLAFTDVTALRKLGKKYPGKIVVSIDHREGVVMVKGWQESTGTGVEEAISMLSSAGASEFLITSIDRDGTLAGPDLTWLSKACSGSAKIIASGGISSIEDVLRVRCVGCASVILGKALYDGKLTIQGAKAVA
jgi:phosphoribosylformimino-5-aminoimidazole carboxamide ribotide isomerase